MQRPSLAALSIAIMMGNALVAQVTVTGRVIDDRANEPLAFVHVVPVGAREGATSDIDGRFTLDVAALPVTLRCSYVGYSPVEVEAGTTGPLVVRMRRTAVELRPVEVFPGENPAHRIIRQVHAARKTNDGLRHRSYRYTSYGKTIFTAALDSAILNDPERLAALDSNDQETFDWFSKQHILLIESATRKSFIPPASEKEEVLAMRVSGLKDPSLLALAASTKTFSMYDAQIVLGEKTYLGPIGPGSTNHYLFLLQDTLFQGSDSVFVISYQPRTGTKFEALKGVLYVNTNGYALQNAIAEPVERTGGASLKLQQQFARIDGRAWFPVQLNTFLYLDFVQVNTWKLMGISRTYLKDIEVDASVDRKEVRGPEFVMDRLAARRDEAIWTGLRTDTLDDRELRTYHTIDSISAAEKIEPKVRWLGYLSSGRAGVGPVDILLDRIVHFNGYEGLRLGFGGATNDKVSRYVALGGYFAYGFQDEGWKYGGDLTLKPKPGRDLALRGYYMYDVAESGGIRFPGTPRTFTSESYRWLYVDRMDRIERIGGELAFRAGSSLRLWLGTERADRVNVIGYQYVRRVGEQVTVYNDRFITGEVSLGLRFAFREQLARLPDRQVALGTRWPVLYVQASRAVEGLWEGEWDLWRMNAMLEKTFRLRMLGDLSMRLMGGMAEAEAPYPFLYNLRGTYSGKLPLATQNTFETMRPDEYLADRYASIHVRHSFGNLLFKGTKFRPVPVIVANAAWGSLSHPANHAGWEFKSLDGGYYEAGLQVDNLLRSGISGFGIGAFYRLGPEQLPEPRDNFALKMSISLAF